MFQFATRNLPPFEKVATGASYIRLTAIFKLKFNLCENCKFFPGSASGKVPGKLEQTEISFKALNASFDTSHLVNENEFSIHVREPCV